MFLCYGPFPKDGENGRKTRKTSERREKNMAKEGRKHERRAERLQKTLKAVVTEIYYYVNYFAQRQQFCTNMCALQSRKLHTRSCLRSLISYLVVLNRCGHWGVDTCVRRCSLSCIEFDIHFTSPNIVNNNNMCNSAHFWPVALKSRGRWRRPAAGSTRAVFTHVCYRSAVCC